MSTFEDRLKQHLKENPPQVMTEEAFNLALTNTPIWCPICGEGGQLTYRLTKGRSGSYRYWYVRHSRPANRDAYCYVDKLMRRFIQDCLTRTKQVTLFHNSIQAKK